MKLTVRKNRQKQKKIIEQTAEREFRQQQKDVIAVFKKKSKKG